MEEIQFTEKDFQEIYNPILQEKLHTLLNAVEELAYKNNQLLKENQQLKAELAKYKQQSPSPSFPIKRYASTPMLKKQTAQTTWKKSRKKETIAIDTIITLPEIHSCTCGSKEFITIRTDKKIIQGISLKRNNTCYVKKNTKCKQCGKVYKAAIPKEIKGMEFDQELRTLISYLKFKCRITQPLLHDVLTDMGISISTGQISRILLENSKKLIPAYTQLRVWGIKQSPYLQTDATGHKFKLRSGKIVDQHIHFLGNSRLSLFKITPRYNASVIDKLLTTRGKKKPLISDDGGANGARLLLDKKQLCWLHEIRHYLKLTPALALHKDQLEKKLAELYAFYALASSYRDSPTAKVKKTLQQQFNRLVNRKTGYIALDYRLWLTKKKKQRLLLFLDHPAIPIHNNQSERDLRPAVIIRKISRETKSVAGNKSIERHLSVIHTAQKQKLNVFKTLHGLLTNTLSPFVLTTNPS